LNKAKFEFRRDAKETDPKKIATRVLYAEDMLDSLVAQVEHLNSLMDREPDEEPQPPAGGAQGAKTSVLSASNSFSKKL
jgi:hypothetical protein